MWYILHLLISLLKKDKKINKKEPDIGPSDHCPNCGMDLDSGKICRWPSGITETVEDNKISAGCLNCRYRWFYYEEKQWEII